MGLDYLSGRLLGMMQNSRRVSQWAIDYGRTFDNYKFQHVCDAYNTSVHIIPK